MQLYLPQMFPTVYISAALENENPASYRIRHLTPALHRRRKAPNIVQRGYPQPPYPCHIPIVWEWWIGVLHTVECRQRAKEHRPIPGNSDGRISPVVECKVERQLHRPIVCRPQIHGCVSRCHHPLTVVNPIGELITMSHYRLCPHLRKDGQHQHYRTSCYIPPLHNGLS